MFHRMLIPKIPEAERTPLVVALLEIIQLQQEQIQALKDEIAQLKGEKLRPKIKPSKLEPWTGSKGKEGDNESGKRPGSAKRSKLDELEIHETVVLKPESVPAGSTFKGYEECTVQAIILKAHNILYRRERWETPEGGSIVALSLLYRSNALRNDAQGALDLQLGKGHLGRSILRGPTLVLEVLWVAGVPRERNADTQVRRQAGDQEGVVLGLAALLGRLRGRRGGGRLAATGDPRFLGCPAASRSLAPPCRNPLLPLSAWPNRPLDLGVGSPLKCGPIESQGPHRIGSGVGGRCKAGDRTLNCLPVHIPRSEVPPPEQPGHRALVYLPLDHGLPHSRQRPTWIRGEHDPGDDRLDKAPGMGWSMRSAFGNELAKEVDERAWGMETHGGGASCGVQDQLRRLPWAPFSPFWAPARDPLKPRADHAFRGSRQA